jgi:hypothetical protein
MFELNLYLTLNTHKGDIKIMLMNIESNNLASRLRTKFGSNNNISKHKDH